MLIDRQIREALGTEDLKVSPHDSIYSRIQPASLDVRLGSTFLRFASERCGMIDTKTDTSGAWDTIVADDSYIVAPGELVLASTLEAIGLSDTMLARVEGKSSLGRLGVLVHATAGYIDPGWPMATITLEISIAVNVPVKLYVGMPIAQLAFERVEPVNAVYAGKYTGQDGPVPSKYHKNWSGSRWM